MSFYAYIMASRRNGTLYVGSTDDIAHRAWQHRTGALPDFTRRYSVRILVWYEVHDSGAAAFTRERQIKEWHRAWKLRLIEAMNPGWADLYDTLNN